MDDVIAETIRATATTSTSAVHPRVSSAASNLGLSEPDFQALEVLWAATEKVEGQCVLPPAAVALFNRSGLPKEELSFIWHLADAAPHDGKLTRDEFFKALKMIALRQAGLPATEETMGTQTGLPMLEGITLGSTRPELPAIASTLGLTAQQCTAYESLWAATEKIGEHTHRGAVEFVSPPAAVALFNRSGLAKEELSFIWRLADLEPRGKLTHDQFFKALKMITLSQSGIPANGQYRHTLTMLSLI